MEKRIPEEAKEQTLLMKPEEERSVMIFASAHCVLQMKVSHFLFRRRERQFIMRGI